MCIGPLDTGLQHFAAMPSDHEDVVGARAAGLADVLRLGFPTRAGTVVSLSFDRRSREFTSRDVAMLTMLAPALARLLRAPPAGRATSSLTVSERRVLRHVADGLSNRQAAEELSVSEATVRKHLENTYRKLGVANRAAAVAMAVSPSAGLPVNGQRDPHDRPPGPRVDRQLPRVTVLDDPS